MHTILVADDCRSIREYCRAVLQSDGYRVVLASDGLDAVRVFLEENPDLVVLDLRMPGASGLDALERIGHFAPHVPVVLFTAHEDEWRRDRRAALAAACVEKTNEDLGKLRRIIAGALEPPGPESGLSPVGLTQPPPSCPVPR